MCKVMKSEFLSTFSNEAGVISKLIVCPLKKFKSMFTESTNLSCAITFIPNPIARLATSCPIRPKPIIPKVFPASSFPYA